MRVPSYFTLYMTKREVIRTIRQAFSGVLMPPVSNVVLHFGEEILSEEWANWPDGPNVGRILANKRWQDVDYERLARAAAPLSLMTPEAIQYYLPALLINTLKYPDIMDIDSLKHELSPPPFGYASSLQEFEIRYSLLTPAQRGAVGCFFEYARRTPGLNLWVYDEPLGQISTYWLQDYMQSKIGSSAG